MESAHQSTKCTWNNVQEGLPLTPSHLRMQPHCLHFLTPCIYFLVPSVAALFNANSKFFLPAVKGDLFLSELLCDLRKKKYIY